METNNKLIAEFIGYKEYVNEGAIQLYIKDEVVKSIGQLDFHSDWNWLMEVVEKCLIGEAEHSQDEAKKAISEIYESLCSINISAVYNACISFIEWYNENSAKEK